VLALAALAVVDALRRDESRPAATPDPALADAEGELRAAGVRGTLVTAEGGPAGCTTRARRLPELDPVTPPSGRGLGCGVSVSPDGRLEADAAAWSARSDRYAICRGATAYVFAAGARRASEAARRRSGPTAR
jgi:hypothetical protein